MEQRIALAGESFLSGGRVTVLAPQETDYSDINESSVALRVVFGDTAFLFTGDAGRVSEEEMLRVRSDAVRRCAEGWTPRQQWIDDIPFFAGSYAGICGSVMRRGE